MTDFVGPLIYDDPPILKAHRTGSLAMRATTYEFDYYSGSQISIYVGDVLLEDIEAISFNVQQSKQAIYGYASQYYNAVADGQVMVQGQLYIPFKEAQYLLAILDTYHRKNSPISRGRESNTYLVERENIERYLESQRISGAKKALQGMPDVTFNDKSGYVAGKDKYDFYRDLSALTDEAFENQAEAFEDALWKKNEDNYNTSNLKDFRGAHNTRRGDQYPPFDIWILYGDIANAAANHTIKKLVEVSILGQGQTIEVGGQPISETYSFFARNLV